MPWRKIGGQLTGLPARQVIDTTRATIELGAGETKDLRELLYSKYALEKNGDTTNDENTILKVNPSKIGRITLKVNTAKLIPIKLKLNPVSVNY